MWFLPHLSPECSVCFGDVFRYVVVSVDPRRVCSWAFLKYVVYGLNLSLSGRPLAYLDLAGSAFMRNLLRFTKSLPLRKRVASVTHLCCWGTFDEGASAMPSYDLCNLLAHIRWMSVRLFNGVPCSFSLLVHRSISLRTRLAYRGEISAIRRSLRRRISGMVRLTEGRLRPPSL